MALTPQRGSLVFAGLAGVVQPHPAARVLELLFGDGPAQNQVAGLFGLRLLFRQATQLTHHLSHQRQPRIAGRVKDGQARQGQQLGLIVQRGLDLGLGVFVLEFEPSMAAHTLGHAHQVHTGQCIGVVEQQEVVIRAA